MKKGCLRELMTIVLVIISILNNVIVMLTVDIPKKKKGGIFPTGCHPRE